MTARKPTPSKKMRRPVKRAEMKRKEAVSEARKMLRRVERDVRLGFVFVLDTPKTNGGIIWNMSTLSMLEAVKTLLRNNPVLRQLVLRKP